MALGATALNKVAAVAVIFMLLLVVPSSEGKDPAADDASCKEYKCISECPSKCRDAAKGMCGNIVDMHACQSGCLDNCHASCWSNCHDNSSSPACPAGGEDACHATCSGKCDKECGDKQSAEFKTCFPPAFKKCKKECNADCKGKNVHG